jgi:hypothetical protein
MAPVGRSRSQNGFTAASQRLHSGFTAAPQWFRSGFAVPRSHDLSRYRAVRGRRVWFMGRQTERAPRVAEPVPVSRSACR